MSEELVLLTMPQPNIGLVTLNRPAKYNALSSAMLDQFDVVLERVAADRELRVVVLTGAGKKAFIAGADIGEYGDGSAAAFARYQFRSRAIFDRLEALPQPTIAALRGYALGGGFEIALCCDILMASRDARLGLPEGTLGLVPGGGGTQRLSRAVGKYAASELLLGGGNLDAQRALQLGIVAEVCEPEDLLSRALDKAAALLKVAPTAHLELKRLIRQGLDAPLPVSQSLEQEVLIRLFSGQNAREGVQAFLEKRKPAFGPRD